jgi:hypothetical protein
MDIIPELIRYNFPHILGCLIIQVFVPLTNTGSRTEESSKP